MDFSTLEKIDSQKMYKVYDNWANIAKKSFESENKPLELDNIDQIVFAGMGGSGTIGDIFSSILSNSKIHISIVKGYILPKTVNSKSLIICTSVSGNTIETISVLKEAKNLGCRLVAFSSGGIMESFCKSNNIDFRKIDFCHSPRASFMGFLFSILKILEQITNLTKSDVYETIKLLDKISKNISSNNLTSNNSSLNFAEKMNGIPLIYYPHGLEAAAIRFKNSLQENAKMHVFYEDVIEACHNSIVSWEKKSFVQPILIQGVDDNIKTKERWKILKKYFKENNIEYLEIYSVAGNILSKLVCLIYILDYCSIYKAVILEINPTPVNSIDYLKKMTNN